VTAPRFGPLYTSAVLRPFAEQLIDSLALASDSAVCDLLCDGGALSGALADAVPGGSLVVADVDATVVGDVTRALAGAPCSVRGVVSDGRSLPVESRSCDCVASLFTIGFADAPALLLDALRVARAGGAVAILHWEKGALPAHEDVLATALAETTGARSSFFDHIAPRLQPPPGASITRLHDVVRLDGIEHYWAAMATEGRRGDAVQAASAASLSALRAICEARLAPYTAADGTMRIPVDAVLVRMTAGFEPYDVGA
jgi:SAM-dependent methyltransferase